MGGGRREGRAWVVKEGIEVEGGGSDDPEGGSEAGSEECMGGGRREGRAWVVKEGIEVEGGGSDDPEGGSEAGSEECMEGGGEKAGHGW